MNNTKLQFKAALAARLGEASSDIVLLKPLKNGIKLLDKATKQHLGDLTFDYLRNAGGVYVACEVAGGVVHEVLAGLALAHDSNLLTRATMSFNSLSEERKEFSPDIGGVVRVHDGMDIDRTCGEIVGRLATWHIPKMERLLAVSEGLIEDVVAYPDHYAYPLPIIAICLIRNGCEDVEAALAPYARNKRIARNRNLDFLAALEEHPLLAQ
ncbi:hypothetical protein F2P45_01690 [Massilia sp. CCM 8733]|uniref:Uncharacterized protein n=1 Tax=Massilia mucilaginosa TaxID=2609282 RepID=A0ABX0NLQ8_9BURK|nr:hypothetical protein [Massilia mucilaginosa]NHZ87750.1 hypothetical protein [Massilia mucilaginosa]